MGTKKSYVCGTSTKPLLFETIGERLQTAADVHSNQEALVFCASGDRMTYSELNHAADKLAVGLLELGLDTGDRIGIWSPNKLEWVVTLFASAKIGLILVNINPAYRISELEHAMHFSGSGDCDPRTNFSNCSLQLSQR